MENKNKNKETDGEPIYDYNYGDRVIIGYDKGCVKGDQTVQRDRIDGLLYVIENKK